MKTYPSFFKTGLRLLALQCALLLCQTLFAAVTFTNTPSVVSNTYAGMVTLQIGGLTNGETVVLQKFLDLNTNNAIDGNDWLVQQFNLTDGKASVFYDGSTAVTNLNVPCDLNSTTGAITATLNFQGGDFLQNIVGKYLLKLSSPSNHFTPITNLFSVTNFPYAQKFTGNVVNSGTNVPNAAVLLFNSARNGPPLAGAIANNSGGYTIPAPAGTYSLLPFKTNYLCNFAAPPVVTLGGSATVTTNLTLTNATASISGNVVDANNYSLVLPGVMVMAQAANGLMAVGTAGTNGNFALGVRSGQWDVKADDTTLIIHGYAGPQDATNVSAGTTGVTFAVPQATALFYGSVNDNLGNPLAGIDVYASNDGDVYETDGYTGTNGNYFVAVPAGNWYVRVSEDTNPTNYIFSGGQGLTLTNGQAVQWNFTALLATNHITGNVKVNGTNAVGVWVWANADINGTNFQTGMDTDSSGNYWLNVARSNTWTVGVQTGGGDHSLPSGYLCGSQTVSISNNNPVVNFTAILATNHITGHVQDSGGNPIIGLGVSAAATTNSADYYVIAGTDSSGNYSLNVINGNWTVGVLCSGGPGGDMNNLDNILGPGNYQCPNNQSVTISNNNGTANFTVQSSTGVQILTTNLPNGTNGVYYSQPLNASGGQPPYNWSLSPGSQPLPGWLTLDPSGSLYGTPNSAGTNSFSVRVTDNNGNTADQPLSLFISSPVPDVLFYYVTKLEAFGQLDPTNIVLNTNAGPFTAFLGIVQSSLGVVPIATVTLPTGAVKGLPWGSSAIEMRSQESFSSQVSFDAAYPPGNYAFGLYGLHDGLRYPVLSMPFPVYPNPPHVSNFAAAQLLNPLSAFTLQWDAVPGGTTNDTLWVFITDTNGNPVFITPYPPMHPVGSLKGTATSVIIPTNTFQFGHAYVGTITFFRMTSVNTTDYPGAVGATVVGVQTWFPLAMASASPELSQPAKTSSTQFRFLLSGLAGQNYTIQMSTNLNSTNWLSLFITNAPANSFIVIDPVATNPQRFYRALFGP